MSMTNMIHSFAALFTIACILLPFSAFRMGKRDLQQVVHKTSRLATLLRIPHFALIVSLITGLLQVNFTFTSWVWMVLVLFLAIAALLGIISKTVKQINQLASQQQPFTAELKKYQVLSLVLTVAVILMVVIKVV